MGAGGAASHSLAWASLPLLGPPAGALCEDTLCCRGLAGGAAGGGACDWRGWAGRVAGGARESEHRGAGGGAGPAGARYRGARRLPGRLRSSRPGGRYGNFTGLRDPATSPPRDSTLRCSGSGAFGMAEPRAQAGE
ncbi:unnamed protein product [Rangifer tarandus platyrhynchus]|uniref:Uncharacterized protein n=1 Tax=Rangifer tarandus platyrhynchus TaxID=3082113 RepID=A0ABN8ZQA9_RANTA|nr:unnamed protein product [Rangifer tarandus platyrhynchus]